ncbi:MAG TPA: FkbM family methyltransferase, partial [Candidatus Paceibacterota bacterium]|nr:FkbM family methyltransferase [Candidatus Paceibacterota bacterium]
MKGVLQRLKELFSAMRKISSVYGRGPRALLWFRMILTIIQPRLPRAMRRAQRLDLQLQGKSFSIWMQDRTSLAAFEEIFIRGEYSVPDIPQSRIIMDVGANIGVASVYFCVRYPGVRLYSIEPDPDVCTVLRKNLAAYPNASVHQCALSDIDGAIDFHIHPTSSIASSLQSRVSGEKIVPVPS